MEGADTKRYWKSRRKGRNKLKLMKLLKLVEYEIAGSWWVGLMPFGHDWISNYMIRKTKRKLARYSMFLELRKKKQEKEAAQRSVLSDIISE